MTRSNVSAPSCRLGLIGFLVTAFFALFAQSAFATNYFVSSSTGSDANSGTSSTSPWQTLGKVNGFPFQPGDQVEFLRGDTWTGQLSVSRSGTSSARISYFGYGTSSSRPLIQGASGDCVSVDASWVTIDNLKALNCGYAGFGMGGANVIVKNAAAVGNTVGVHARAGSTNGLVDNDTITDNNHLNQNTTSQCSGAFGVLVNGDGTWVGRNHISGSYTPCQAYGWDGSGVEIYNASNAWVHDNRLTNNDTGIEMGGSGTGNLAEYNDIHSNTADTQANGVVFPGTQMGVTLRHLSIRQVGATAQGIVCYSSCALSTVIRDVAVKADSKALYTDNGAITVEGSVFNGLVQGVALSGTNSTAPVGFVSDTDLHLTAGSPAIDRGTVNNFPSDLDDNPSPVGASSDSGAYEYQGTSPPPPGDTTAPTAPTGLSVSGQSQTGLTLSWAASTDPDDSVITYTALKNGAVDGTTTSTSHAYSGLTCGTTYTLGVNAKDAAGNTSATSTTSGTTSACTVGDTTPPSTPTGLSVSGQTQTALTLNWTASTDNVGVAGYHTFLNGTAAGDVTGTTKTFSNLTCGTTYTLGVQAFDAAGNKSGTATASGTTSACPVSTGYQHIVWVLMENHGYNQILNSSSTPYIHSLINTYGSATNMFAECHPSLGNYIALTSGLTTDCGNDSFYSDGHDNVFHQLPAGGSRSLEESMPSNCRKSDSGFYVVRHNPEVMYTDVGGGSSSGGDCATYDVPLGAAPDLSAKLTFVTPNGCHDMHSNSLGCPNDSDVILSGDQFLQSFVPQLMATSQYQAGNTAIFITWDEDNNNEGNHIPTIIVDPHGAHTVGGCQGTRYDHYSMLRYVEDLFAVPRLGNAAGATTMAGCFGL